MKYINMLLLIFIVGGTSACQSLSYPPIEDLLVDETVFPKGWIVSEAPPSPVPNAPFGGSKAVESTVLDFYTYGGGALEEIRRFSSPQEAAEEYAIETRFVFRVTEFNTSWRIPEELTYESSVADQYHYACSQFEGSPWPGCAYVAQYGVYVVQFATGMYPDYMRYTDFENVLRAIDERMTPYATGGDE